MPPPSQIIDIQPGSPLDLRLGELGNALWAINEQLKQLKPIKRTIDNNTTEVTKWLGVIAEAISNITPLPQPQPKMKGSIMSDYAIPADQADGRVTFNLAATDSEGNPITDPKELGKLPFTAVSSDESVFVVTLDADQPDGSKRVGGYHVGAPGQAAVTSNLTQADGDLIATGTDGFTVTTGEATLGSVTSEFEGLTPIS